MSFYLFCIRPISREARTWTLMLVFGVFPSFSCTALLLVRCLLCFCGIFAQKKLRCLPRSSFAYWSICLSASCLCSLYMHFCLCKKRGVGTRKIALAITQTYCSKNLAERQKSEVRHCGSYFGQCCSFGRIWLKDLQGPKG